MTPARVLAWGVPAALMVAIVWAVGASRARPKSSGDRGTVEAGNFPRAVELRDGTRLELPAPPRRVVVANTAVVDLVAELVGPTRVAAVCSQAFTWSLLAREPAGWEQVPTFDAFLVETVLARDPDLVLCSPHSNPETVSSLRELGLPLVRLGEPQDLDEVRENLRLLGQLLGVEGRVAALEEDFDRRTAALLDDPGHRVGRTAAFFSHHGAEGQSAGSRTLADEALRLCGLRNATAARGHVGPVRLDFEQLVGLDPDILVVPAASEEAGGQTVSLLLGEPALRELRAVRAGLVIEIHPSFFWTSSHEIVAAAERIAAAADELLKGGLGERGR